MTGIRLTMMRSSEWRVFSMLPPTTLYERKTKAFKRMVPTMTETIKMTRERLSLRIG